jgi:DNA-binding NarL/FixJ family response regulator
LNVLLVDDHALFRDGLALLLREVDAAVAVQHAADIQQALGALRTPPTLDLVLLDLALPGVGGLEGLRQLREAAEAVPIVVLSANDDPVMVRQCIDTGAMGYVLKTSDARTMIAALRRVFAGAVYLPPLTEGSSAMPEAAAPRSAVASLTPRQREVLRRLVQGKTNKVIARELGIHETTVKSHVTVLLQVLGVQNRTEAVVAVRHLDLGLS